MRRILEQAQQRLMSTSFPCMNLLLLFKLRLADEHCSTYDMNILQHLSERKHGLVLVTLNPLFPVDESTVVGRWTYHHPMMTASSVSSQRLLPEIQNTRGISYVGAWTKYGFHEDGFASAMRLVTAPPFSVSPPFSLKAAQRAVPTASILMIVVRLAVSLLERARRVLEPAWTWISWGVVLVLVWLEQVLAAFRLGEIRNEVVRIRGYWVNEKVYRKIR